MATSAVGFERDIRPLFRDKDIESMSFKFDLSSYEDVRANADEILSVVSAGRMPSDGAWPTDEVARFREWVDAGCPPWLIGRCWPARVSGSSAGVTAPRSRDAARTVVRGLRDAIRDLDPTVRRP